MDLTRLRFDPNDKLTLPPVPQPFIKCRFKTNQHNIENQQIVNFLREIPLPQSNSELFSAPIDSARYLAEGHDVKTTVELFLNIKGSNFSYLPGDSIGILPKNIKTEVVDLIGCLGLSDQADTIVELSVIESTKKKKLPPHLPTELSLFDLFECCLEIRAILKKGFLRALSEHTEAPEEKRRLEEFCSREGTKEYNDFILENSICILDLLSAFPSCKPPLSLLLEHVPRLMPRAYSISSSSLYHKNRIRLVFNIVKDRRGRKGVCSSWLHKLSFPFLDIASQLEDLSLGEYSKHIIVPIYLRKSSNFRVPEDPTLSLIMIGPGTGLAPFIGFLEHKQRQCGIYSNNYNSINSLYFGCRYKGRDQIYRKELKDFIDNGILQNLHISFSRESQEEGSPRYVQDFILNQKEAFVDLLLQENTHLFVCGDAENMAKDVEAAIIKSISVAKNISLEEASQILNQIESDLRYVKDVWR